MLDQLKINNLTNILTSIFAHRTATKAKLVQYTDLSNSTVSASVNSLLELQLLVCAGMEESIGGRRSKIYKLNKDYGCFVGVDMNPEKLVVCVANCENELVDSMCFPLSDTCPVVDQLIEALDSVVEKHDNVLGIGVGLPAAIDYEEQIVIDCPAFGWNHVPLKEILERHFTVFCHIDHRINGAALRESLVGQASEAKNYFCMYESAAEKTALILDGDICRGTNNNVGKIDSVSLIALMEKGLLSFLNIPLVVIGYCTKEYKERMEKFAQTSVNSVICIPEADWDFAVGMAAVTQQNWFKSIYFML